MRTLTILLCGLLLVALTLPTLAKPGGGHRGVAAKDPLTDYLATITVICTPTPDQQTAINTKFQAAETDLHAYDAKNKDTARTLNTGLKDARKAQDKAKIQDFNAQLKPLKDGRDAIIKQFAKDVLTLLTPDQLQAWASYQLRLEVKTYFANAKLTDEQLTKIQPLCDDTAKEIAKLKDDDTLGKAKLKHDLLAKVNNAILTDDQRAAMIPLPGTGKPPKNQ